MTPPVVSVEPPDTLTPPPVESTPNQLSSTLQIPGQTDGEHTPDERIGRTTGSQNASQNVSRATSPRPPSAIHANTQVTYEDPDFTHPPDLNYSLRPRKKALAWFWTLIVLDCVAMPIGMYFGLWYGTTLSPNAGKNIPHFQPVTETVLIISQCLVSVLRCWAQFPLLNISSAFTGYGR